MTDLLNNEDILWPGAYSLFIDYGSLDEFSNIFISYDITINDSIANFSGEGYQTSFDYQCNYAQDNNRLILINRKQIDDLYQIPVEVGDTMGIMYNEDGLYYIQSPFISDSLWNENIRLQIVKTALN